MTPFSPDELAAWLDAEYEALLTAQREDYELQTGEFTAAMYAEAAQVPLSTAHARLLKLREAQRIPHKREKMDGRWVWVYWKED